MHQTKAERDYWLAWAGLIGRGWELLSWGPGGAAFTIPTDTARPPIVINKELLLAMESLAGSRAPKRPERPLRKAGA